jgi:hypothetical protein
MQENIIETVLAIVVSIALAGFGAVTGADPVADDEFGCDDLFAYRNDVYQSFAGYPEFLDWWAESDSPAIEAINPEDAEVLVEQGRGFVETLDGLDVPPVYADGHEGIMGLYGFFNDLIAWVVLEEGEEPDTDDLSVAIEQVIAGEESAAANCVTAIEELDGYVLIDPAGLDEEDVPEDPGDVDKTFL